MQHGCITIASNIGGLPEVLKNAGVFFKPGSDVDLAAKMLWLASNPAILELLKKRAFERSDQDFSDELIADLFKKRV
jgi:glycosyltransferase involved in cell wall biosynthesis